ncbi:glycosyltransferase family 2 protein [Streptomyces sp. LP05-1]|uniref:dolichyl-phosphate beta-glucosyltransferase n=1 Tax=Streptomyces pyxinae TaxID=2970734 RepID=A0ABT2CML4_9ACTN|nr:dolichyl-phosphate beta-glucosyltransferase [Streptomyces sp. LP05-1]MCS0638663.1 glycosyltransferase family 2 protein [Streptomyces sp. LP05-1]
MGPPGGAVADPPRGGVTDSAADVARPASVARVALSVVVPAYNEEERLPATLAAIRAHLTAAPDRWGDWELIVADDGSTDGTARVVSEAAADEPRIRLERDPVNRGKGGALRRGVLASTGRRVLVTDADLATPIEELDRLADALEPAGGQPRAAAIGSRALPGSRIETHQHRLREWLGRLGNRLIRAVAVPGIRDTQCGFKLFDGPRVRRAFADSRLNGWGIDVEILRHFRRAGWPVAEVPVRWAHQDGSKVGAPAYAQVLWELVRLRARAVRRVDLVVAGLFLLGSVLLYRGLWADLDHSYLRDSMQDQNQWEWFFAVTADNVGHLRNPLFTTAQGFPEGVNLMANTVMLGLSVPLTPVTLVFGPTVTWALVLTLGLTATACAWYWLFARWVVRGRSARSRCAAALGAGLAAAAPPMVSHGTAHPNFLVLFMIPVIVDRALRLSAGRAVVRDGVLLGLFTAYQIFLGEEPLLLAAVGMLLFALSYALARRDVVRTAGPPLLKGVGIAAVVCLPLVALPLYWQFFGPQSYHSVLHGPDAGNSPLALLEFSGRSLLGDEATADRLAMNRTEQNAFYGWPLIALAVAVAVRLWRLPLVRALAATGLVAAALSLGTRVRLPYTDLVVPGPWRLLAEAPLFESVIESRVAMICAPVLGAGIALAVERLAFSRFPAVQVAGLVAVGAALLPILPTPYPVREREAVPGFVAYGTYRQYLGPGETLVPVPLPDPSGADALHWQTAADFGFRMPGGYFNGPWGPDRIGIYGATPRYTSDLLGEVRWSGRVPAIGPEWRAQARRDLAEWKAGVLVLPPQYNEAALYETVSKLLSRKGERIGGAWVWDLH